MQHSSVNYPIVRKGVDVVDLIGLESKGSDEADSAYLHSNLPFYLVKGGDETLYVSLEDYAAMLSFHIKGTYRNVFEKTGVNFAWTVAKGNTAEYQLIAQHVAERFSVAGSLSGAMDIYPDLSKSSLYSGASFYSGYLARPYESHLHSSFTFLHYKSYIPYGGFFVPLSWWDTEVGLNSGIAHFYDGERVYQYSDVSQLTDVPFQGKTAAQRAMDYYLMHGMPSSLKNQIADSVYYLFQNYYGLPHDLGMYIGTFLTRNGIRAGIVSEDREKSNQYFEKIFGLLDDDHTGVLNVASWWGETVDAVWRGPNSKKRSSLAMELRAQRAATFEAKKLSSDSIQYKDDMAMFGFDSFAFDYEAFDAEGKLKEDLWKTDSFFYFIRQLEAIKSHGGVKKVIIDMSLNGGGVVGVMMKILALLSKNNDGTIHLREHKNGGVTKMQAGVDSNLDGTFGIGDVYGNDFEFYIVTSDMSFSCGNALPYYAKKYGFAKIIGEKSGGGECVVCSGFYPQGVAYVMSSNNHIGYYDGKDFEGDEAGVQPDIGIPHSEFYDIEKIAAYL